MIALKYILIALIVAGMTGSVLACGCDNTSPDIMPEVSTAPPAFYLESLVVMTHLGYSPEQAQYKALDIFAHDPYVLYVYFLDGYGFDREGKIVTWKTDLNNVTALRTAFPGAF